MKHPSLFASSEQIRVDVRVQVSDALRDVTSQALFTTTIMNIEDVGRGRGGRGGEILTADFERNGTVNCCIYSTMCIHVTNDPDFGSFKNRIFTE